MNNKISNNASIAFPPCEYDPYSRCAVTVESRKLQHHSLTFQPFLFNSFSPIRDQCLARAFLSLFAITRNQEDMVSYHYDHDQGWTLTFSSLLSDQRKAALGQLLHLLQADQMLNEPNSFTWAHDSSGTFTVLSSISLSLYTHARAHTRTLTTDMANL